MCTMSHIVVFIDMIETASSFEFVSGPKGQQDEVFEYFCQCMFYKNSLISIFLRPSYSRTT